MNFDEAIRAHSDWKVKLSLYLKKPDHSLKSGDIQIDSKCALGQWIYGEGGKYSQMSEFQTLKAEHAHFHRAAAQVVQKADAGQNVGDDVAIGSASEFGKASSTVVSAIMHMKAKVH